MSDTNKPKEPTPKEIAKVAAATNREELAEALRAIDPRILAECGIV